ncbi:hypothetical protein ABZ023_31910 [Streptomyces sp. NPDC006367]|uniref:hypothetical protein n=1 Tax=unclassified Streptomyces TaxID=2593676 RepID=UPI0033A4827A
MFRIAAVLLASAALIVAVGTSGAVSHEAPDAGRTSADDGFGWVTPRVVASDGGGWVGPQGGTDTGQGAGAGQLL